ncbi:hypothetical protein LSH36_224g01019 [Paralvinella palmiformis]|uniref:Uncharacterized protein n=1 Tax=Paralvinella palmiformis TaxID=53620 RepID=A0AAD9JN02_9ANNE|nr:hypothetical protein LSH36_224g01019 [Paralvinella palmiformis]
MAAVTAAYPGWLDRSYPYPEGKPSPDLYDYGDSRADDVSPLKADGSDDEFTQTLEALRKRAQMIRLPAKRRNYPLIKLKKTIVIVGTNLIIIYILTGHCWNMFDMCCTANICGPEGRK